MAGIGCHDLADHQRPKCDPGSGEGLIAIIAVRIAGGRPKRGCGLAVCVPSKGRIDGELRTKQPVGQRAGGRPETDVFTFRERKGRHVLPGRILSGGKNQAVFARQKRPGGQRPGLLIRPVGERPTDQCHRFAGDVFQLDPVVKAAVRRSQRRAVFRHQFGDTQFARLSRRQYRRGSRSRSRSRGECGRRALGRRRFRRRGRLCVGAGAQQQRKPQQQRDQTLFHR